MAGGMPGMPGADEAAAGAAAAGMPDLASMMGGMNPRKYQLSSILYQLYFRGYAGRYGNGPANDAGKSRAG